MIYILLNYYNRPKPCLLIIFIILKSLNFNYKKIFLLIYWECTHLYKIQKSFFSHYVNFTFICIQTVKNSHLILINKFLRVSCYYHSFCWESEYTKVYWFYIILFVGFTNASQLVSKRKSINPVGESNEDLTPLVNDLFRV